jgi:multidrug transporter EmrE-like cation transporter
VGLGFVFTIAIGILIGEQVSSVRLIGVALICTGVFIVGQS